jgi:hypothetical protein
MGVLACDNCGTALSENVVDFGETYIRLCDDCYNDVKDKTISELLEQEEKI